ncbi:MAG: hypothetical protein JNL77_06005 [Nitrosomonas sp.]|nr:hypothetical protein [Nitrosomonas sp.]
MNNAKFLKISSSFLVLVSLGGCAIGFDHTLFMTKSNVGVDIDTKAPTAELSIARRELVIAPTFEGGQTPPVHASFSTGQRLLFGFDVSSVFSGGDAAATISEKVPYKEGESELCLSERPVGRPYLLGLIPLGTYELPKPSEIHPFVFGTDTTFGVKVAWSGMTAQFPDSLKIGFNRKELALAPVILRENEGVSQKCVGEKKKFSAEMPSFLATIRVATDFASPSSQNAKYRQSFSTGVAATKLAQNPYVKELIWTLLDRAQEPEKGTYGPDNNSKCIQDWLSADTTKQAEHVDIINKWWMHRSHIDKSWPLLITSKEHGAERSKFVEEMKIDTNNCKGA